MSNIIVDENGNSIWSDPQERLAEIEKVLTPTLKDLKAKIQKNEERDVPRKMNFLTTITNLLDANLRKKPLVRYDYAVNITAEILQQYASSFFDLLIFIRGFVPEYIANKQTFCAFASISVGAFNTLQNSADAEIVAITDNLGDSFLETNMTGAMGGTVNSMATFNRMRAKEAGMGMSLTQNGDEVQSSTVVVLDNESVKKRLSSMFNNTIKAPK